MTTFIHHQAVEYAALLTGFVLLIIIAGIAAAVVRTTMRKGE